MKLCHYTNSVGMIGILNKEKEKIVLWCTHADCLNDYSEGKDVIRIYKKAIKELLEENIIDQEKYDVLKDIKMPNKHTYILDLGKDDNGIRTSTGYSEEYDPYICSFCESDDLLDMWRYYSKGDIGYALTFFEHEVKEDLKEENTVIDTNVLNIFDFKKVIYNRNEKKSIIKKIINKNINCFGDYNYCDAIAYELSELRYVFKHECFENERERRLIVKVPKRDAIINRPTIKYRPSNGMIIPYIEIELSKNCLKKVMLSPLASEITEKMAKKYVGSFMGDNVFDVEKSDLPIRF